jgi:tetratricopeptide (TPR) repeat protein
MLFDLRARGRRRTVQVVYLMLALLLGGGLVLFGIGGDVQGGLVDAITGNQGGSGNEQIEEQVDDRRKAAEANPQNAAAWAALARSEYQLAGVSDGFNENDPNNPFTGESREHLAAAAAAWERHLRLVGEGGKPDAQTAAIMRNVYAQNALNKPDQAVRAQEVVIEANPNAGVGDYAQLAALAYAANQTRKGDLAAEKAVDLAPRGQKAETRQAIESAKAQAIQQAAGAQSAPQPLPPDTTPETTGGNE